MFTNTASGLLPDVWILKDSTLLLSTENITHEYNAHMYNYQHAHQKLECDPFLPMSQVRVVHARHADIFFCHRFPA